MKTEPRCISTHPSPKCENTLISWASQAWKHKLRSTDSSTSLCGQPHGLAQEHTFQGTPSYLLLVEVPLEFVQSGDGLVVHLEDVAGSSGEHPGCDVTLRERQYSYWLEFPGFWFGEVDIESQKKGLSIHCELMSPVSLRFCPLIFDMEILFLHLSPVLPWNWHILFVFWNRGLQHRV